MPENSSKYKGVTWHNSSRVWQAQIYVKGKRIHLGSFSDEKKAAIAYDKESIKNGMPTNILKPKK